MRLHRDLRDRQNSNLEYIQDFQICSGKAHKERLFGIEARYLYNICQTVLLQRQNRFQKRIGGSGKYHERYIRTIFERPLTWSR